MSTTTAEPEEKLAHVSYSSTTLHRSCPQAWVYRHVRGLDRIDQDDAKVELNFGNWWHALRAAEAIDRGRDLGSIQWVPDVLTTVDAVPGPDAKPVPGPEISTEETETPVKARVLIAAEKWWETLSETVKDTWGEKLGEGETLLTRLVYIDARWHERWDTQLANEEPLAVELTWERRLPPSEEGVDPMTIIVGGIDEIYYDRRRGLVIARDAKSHKTLSGATSAEDMLDSQLQIYAWGAAPLVKEWGYGQIRAVAYDRVRTVAPKRPQVTATGNLSKSITDFDLHTYRSWSEGPDGEGVPWGVEDEYFKTGKRAGEAKFGRYEAEEVVEKKLAQPDEQTKWFQRTLTPLNRNIVATHLRSMIESALDSQKSRQRFELTGDAARSFAKHCQWCPFADLCRAEMVGGPEGEYDLEAMRLGPRVRRRRA